MTYSVNFLFLEEEFVESGIVSLFNVLIDTKMGQDKNDEAAIAEADRVRLEAIGVIDEFLYKNAL
jgi:hypothetical protein